MYALLQNKSRAVYCELFDAIIDKCHELGYDLQVQTVVTDFEEAVLRAVSSSFGRGVQNKGCFYHLTQNTWRKVQQLGLTNHYKTDDNFRLFCGMMDGLAFLPPDFVSDGMDYLKEIVPQEAEELLTYFDQTYVSGTFRQQPQNDQHPQQGQIQNLRIHQVPPLYPPTVWNTHEATLTGNARTNNICEGWNNKFCEPGGTSPSISLENHHLVPEGKCHRASLGPARHCRTSTQKANQTWIGTTPNSSPELVSGLSGWHKESARISPRSWTQHSAEAWIRCTG